MLLETGEVPAIIYGGKEQNQKISILKTFEAWLKKKNFYQINTLYWW